MSLTPDDPFAAERPLVLVATTDGQTRIAVARAIAHFGLSALIAMDEATALAAARDNAQNLVGAILDAHLSTLPGWEIAYTLHVTFGSLPLAVLSDQTQAAPADDLGAAAIFAPSDRPALIAYLGSLAISVEVA
ncbi:MAG: hypothetical protein HGA65_02310 [Oscillochloris sp.]|nr:hypothetical protein [Oscillochloris sp.]